MAVAMAASKADAVELQRRKWKQEMENGRRHELDRLPFSISHFHLRF